MARTHYNIVLIDGNFDHIDVRDDNGNLQPLDLSGLAALVPGFNETAWAKATRVESEYAKLREELTAEHAEALAGKIAELNASHAKDSADTLLKHYEALAAKSDRIGELEAEIDLLKNPPQPDILSELGSAFKAAVPVELQGMFGVHFAVVRILLQAGEIELARSTVEAIQVPEELAGAKAQILSLLP